MPIEPVHLPPSHTDNHYNVFHVCLFYLYVFLQNVYYFLGRIFHCLTHVVASQDTESVSNKTAGSSCLWLSPSLSAMFRGLCCICAPPGSTGQPPSCQGLTKASSARLCPRPGQGRFSRTDCFPHCLLVRNSAKCHPTSRSDQVLRTTSLGAMAVMISNVKNHLLILTECVKRKCISLKGTIQLYRPNPFIHSLHLFNHSTNINCLSTHLVSVLLQIIFKKGQKNES